MLFWFNTISNERMNFNLFGLEVLYMHVLGIVFINLYLQAKLIQIVLDIFGLFFCRSPPVAQI